MSTPAPPPPPLTFPTGTNERCTNEKEIEKHEFSDKIIWARTIKSASLPEEGSGGVIFVKFKAEQYPPVVVKGTSTLVQEIFALELANALKINVPRYYIVNFTQRAFREIQYNLRSKVGARGCVVEKELNRPFLLVMEQINGKSIFELATENGKEPEQIKQTISNYFGNSKYLKQIGKILLLDVLLNNLDRMPLIWDNEGNLENLLFSKETESVYAIDQAIYPVSKKLEKNYNEYLRKVTNLVDDLTTLNWKSCSGSALDKVKNSVQLWTNYDFSDHHLHALRQGILETIQFVIDNISKEFLSDMKSKIGELGKIDWQDVFKTGFNAINLTFLHDVIDIFHSKKNQVALAIEENSNLLG